MATVSRPRGDAKRRDIPPLENGDHLDQPTFHERYLAMPAHVKAELIGGIVYMAAAQKNPHGRLEPLVIRWLDEYCESAIGTAIVSNATHILGTQSEPQPDVCLIIEPEFGGQTHVNEDEFIVGPPELAIEISYSSESIDLNRKLIDYQDAGVREYLVVALRRQEVFWFVNKRRRFKPLPLGKDGIFRSEVFPGLWLNPQGLLARDRQRVLAVLRQGLATPAHEAFVAKLAKKLR